MCLIMYFNSHFSLKTMIKKKKKIAGKRISVYKIMEIPEKGKYVSPYRKFTYEPYMHYYEDKPLSPTKSGYQLKIKRGLYSYAMSKKGKIHNKSILYTNPQYVLCYIPKGATYFTDGHECVSDQLIFTGEIINPWKLIGIKKPLLQR